MKILYFVFGLFFLISILSSCGNSTRLKREKFEQSKLQEIKKENQLDSLVSVIGNWKLIKKVDRRNQIDSSQNDIYLKIDIDSTISKLDGKRIIFSDAIERRDSFIYDLIKKDFISINWSPYAKDVLVIRYYEFEGDLEYYKRANH